MPSSAARARWLLALLLCGTKINMRHGGRYRNLKFLFQENNSTYDCQFICRLVYRAGPRSPRETGREIAFQLYFFECKHYEDNLFSVREKFNIVLPDFFSLCSPGSPYSAFTVCSSFASMFVCIRGRIKLSTKRRKKKKKKSRSLFP